MNQLKTASWLVLLTVVLHARADRRSADSACRVATREYEADHTGAKVSGDRMALASALCKLERATQVIPSQTAQAAFAHLYIVNPLGGTTLSTLFSTHPPLEERIRRLQAMAGGVRA
jgi:heat shock protein HtpX